MTRGVLGSWRGTRDDAGCGVHNGRHVLDRRRTTRPAHAWSRCPHGQTASRLDWGCCRRRAPARRGPLRDQGASRRTPPAPATRPGWRACWSGANGSRMFLKAASKKAQRPFAAAYAEEIRKLRSLPSGLPIPRLVVVPRGRPVGAAGAGVRRGGEPDPALDRRRARGLPGHAAEGGADPDPAAGAAEHVRGRLRGDGALLGPRPGDSPGLAAPGGGRLLGGGRRCARPRATPSCTPTPATTTS